MWSTFRKICSGLAVKDFENVRSLQRTEVAQLCLVWCGCINL